MHRPRPHISRPDWPRKIGPRGRLLLFFPMILLEFLCLGIGFCIRPFSRPCARAWVRLFSTYLPDPEFYLGSRQG